MRQLHKPNRENSDSVKIRDKVYINGYQCNDPTSTFNINITNYKILPSKISKGEGGHFPP